MSPLVAAFIVFAVLLVLDFVAGAVLKRPLGRIVFPIVAGVVCFIVFSFV